MFDVFGKNFEKLTQYRAKRLW